MDTAKNRYVQVNQQTLPVFKALSSRTRLAIIELLQEQNLSIQDVSEKLNISSAMVTKHITILEENNLVTAHLEKGVRGRLKICKLNKNDMTLIFNANKEEFQENQIKKRMPIGSFYDFNVTAPCGMATVEKIIGYVDDPRVFYYQDKDDIKLIWLTSGSLDYHIPIYDIDLCKVKEIEITLELCAESPGYKLHAPSKLNFQLNQCQIGSYVSPGDFGNRQGRLTPTWWHLGTQFGRLITIRVSKQGTFIEENLVSSITIDNVLNGKHSLDTLDFRIETDSQEGAGFNLFGNKFGDFSQDIQITFNF